MSSQNKDNTEPAKVVEGKAVRALVPADVRLPEVLEGKLNLTSWAESIVNGLPYNEPDPNYLSRMLLIQTLTAPSFEAALTQANIRKLQESIPNVPGGSTGPIRVDDIYITASDFGEGAPCYMILTTTDLETGVEYKYTTGAQALQGLFLKAIAEGIFPIQCQITRTDRKDKGGRFLFWLFPPD